MELEQVVLFQGLPPETVSRIRRLTKIAEYEEDETIFLEGDPAEDVIILREGAVELTFSLPHDPTTEIRITRIAPGENFAWSSLALGGTLSSRARALERSRAFLIPAGALHDLFRREPATGYEVMTRLAQQILTRLRETRKELRWLHLGAR